MSVDIASKLQASRKELLDIGMRNSMLNYRSPAKSVQIVDELSTALFEVMYRQGKLMSFVPLTDKKVKALAKAGHLSKDADAFDDLTEELLQLATVDTASSDQHYDTKLQTAMHEGKLFSTLLKIYNDANAYMEEQGVNTLFLALGFLHWYEDDKSEVLRRAPLLLLPVKIERKGAGDDFKLSYNGDELMPNLSLYAKIRTDFNIDLSSSNFDEDAFGNSEAALEGFYQDISKIIARYPRWQVAKNDIALGFFSFGKFLMFNDLDPKSWPPELAPDKHPVLSGLLSGTLGDGSDSYDAEPMLDKIIAPGEVSFVKDADSSQTEALLAVRDGKNLVIQGPPGTGKSQTITNIIAELVRQNKTVLFVAEKMAALEVVKRRLDESHVGDAVLELHSQKATRMSVIKELDRTLQQGQPQSVAAEQDFARLQQVRDYLNRYCEIVAQSVANSGLAFTEVLGRYLRLKREQGELPTVDFAPMQPWSQQQFEEQRQLIEDFVLHIASMGRPDRNVFWGCDVLSFSPIQQEQSTAAFNQLIPLLNQLQADTQALAALLRAEPAADQAALQAQLLFADYVVKAPNLAGVAVDSGAWLAQQTLVGELLASGEQMQTAKHALQGKVIEAAWQADVLSARQGIAVYGGKWWRIFSGQYRAAKNALQGLMQGELPKTQAEQLQLLDHLLGYQQAQKQFAANAHLGQQLFGLQWQQAGSNWSQLAGIQQWLTQFHQQLQAGELPANAPALLQAAPDLTALTTLVARIRSGLQSVEQQLSALVQLTGIADLAARFEALPIAQAEAQARQWMANLGTLAQLARFNQLAAQLRAQGLQGLVTMAQSSEDASNLLHVFDATWYGGLLGLAYEAQPMLRDFDRAKHEQEIERFKALDFASLQHSQNQLAKQIWHYMPNINQPGEMGILRNELNKKKRHIPIRQLIERAGRVIQQIKPVFMMSPMSIASFLPPGKISFDVVIFDEASQVKTVDAFGAILRGRQVIVVGDTRQMPPTDFFGRAVEFDEEENTTGDIESILSLFKAAGCTEKYLRWHYRSRHESLIAVSNAEFYESKLVVFPSAGQQEHATGVKFIHLPDTVYDRGETRTNKGEAQAVARAVLEHARTKPQLSLGVAAFSVVQRDAIQDAVELLRREHPEVEAFFSAHPTEPFFIKNLENIQGDERDVIYISVGYGKVAGGKMIKSFGPLNADGGHRRLNVLITRAKLAMHVFANFRADELELDANAKHGVRALKNFLKYAETGKLEVARETGRKPDSAFEMEVITALRERGYQVEPQVGTAGYFIDIAVRDPNNPGAYILAIECDGASYHSSKTARDRDRLRQSVLEGLGWNFHRIWSTDWFRNREQELDRAVAAIEYAIEHKRLPSKPVEAPVVFDDLSLSRVEVERELEQLATVPYSKLALPLQQSGNEIHQEPIEKILPLVKAVVEHESPVHVADITRRIMVAYGVTKAGARITNQIEYALDTGKRQRLFTVRGEFAYRNEHNEFAVRDRSALETSERKFERIAPEELDQALIGFIGLGFAVPVEDAVSGALNALGFTRATAKVREAMLPRIQQLVKAGVLTREDNVLTVATATV